MRHSLAILSYLVALACAGAAPATQPTPRLPHPTTTPPELPRAMFPTDTVDVLVKSLSTRQKVAQLVMPWMLGDSLSMSDPMMREAVRWVQELEVGGIIMSTGTPRHIAWKLNKLQQLASLPLLVSADFEAGTTLRMRAGTPFPTQMGIAAGGQTSDAYQMGRITGIEGRAVGVHVAFAPVADINSNPNNPIINTRSFGGDPHDVGRFVAATIRGMRDGGIISTAKHFPGHGDTETDSHLSLPTITAGWTRFDTLELVPFRAAIDAGVDAIMSAHIALPALDNGQKRAGTLSPAILTGILRDSLGFKGLVATDALSMGAIATEIGSEEAVVRAFEAGSDLLLMPSDVPQAIDAMVAAVESGRIAVTRLDQSVRRILEMKERMGLFQSRLVDESVVDSIVSNPEFLEIARGVTQRSVVLLKDSLQTVAKLRRAPTNVALIVVAADNSLGNPLAQQFRSSGYTADLVRLPLEPTSAQMREAISAINAASATVIATSVKWGSAKGTIGMAPSTARALNDLSSKKPTVLISFGSPYVIKQVPAAASYLIGWSSTPMAQRAVANALAGKADITGTAPIMIPPSFTIRSGIRMVGR